MEKLKVTKELGRVIVIALLLAFSLSMYAGTTKPTSVLLQEGIYVEEIEGNLDEAINIYQQVIESSEQMVQSAAQATYRIGLCYLKKGDTNQAAEQFKELVTKYPDQQSLVNEAQKQLEKLQPPVTYSFGPVIERIVNDDGEESDWLIDLDTGRLYSHSTDIDSEQEFIKWVEDNKIDIMGDIGPTVPGLYGFDMAILPISNSSWLAMSAQELTDELSITKSGSPSILSAEGELPKTYEFKTREGGIGLLQILEMQDEISPRHFMIRYKMLRKEHDGFLPNADDFIHQGAPVILNLSTGNFLNGYFDKDYIKQLQEGDIAYMDDEGKDVIACLRGAKITRKSKNGQSSDTPDQSHSETNLNLYLIDIPSEMFVTTKEGETYELTILSKVSKGINIKYAKTLIQPQIAKNADSDETSETGDPQAALKMGTPLYGMFSSGYEALIKNNDPNTAQAIVEIAIPQLEKFENLMKGTDAAQAVGMVVQMARELNKALKNGEIEKAKSLINAINEAGPGLAQMVEEEASKAQNASKATNSNSIELEQPLPPVVINTEPKNYSNNVSPHTTEISVTFDREMMDGSWSWVKWNYTFPETTGKPSYDQTKTTCTLPVKLEPSKAYFVRINAAPYDSFMSTDRTKAQPFVLVFSTLDKNGKPSPIPDEMLNFAKQVNSEIKK